MAQTSLPAILAAGALLLGPFFSLQAQRASTPDNSAELAFTFNAQRSLKLNSGQNFWAEGGSVELGLDAFRGFGIAANITGVQTSSMGSSGIPLALVTETFGPRYRWHDGHRLSAYGEGLAGEANAFNSLFPSVSGAQTDAIGLATQVGGGLDLRLGHHLAVRALDAAWLRTQLPNSASNVQNNLRLAAGIVFRMGHR